MKTRVSYYREALSVVLNLGMPEIAKILEIFSKMVVSGDESQRELGLRLLETLDPNLAKRLALAVAAGEKEGSTTKQVANEEAAKAAQRESDMKSLNLCDKYNNYTADQWKKKFLNETRQGTWHVFVATLGAGTSLDEAERVAKSFGEKHKNISFQPMMTVHSSDMSNQRFAIVIAEGLDDVSLAIEVANFARNCGIANDAFAFQQSW